MHVTALRIHPVKSTAGIELDAAEVEPWGLAGDRRWAVTDEQGRKLTARTHRRLLHVTAWPGVDGAVTLEGPGMAPLPVTQPSLGEVAPVDFSRLAHATRAGGDADRWLSRFLGVPARLVWLDDPRRRPVDVRHGGREGDALSLADAGPVLLTSGASLRMLDRWIAGEAVRRGEPVPPSTAMARFRPNIVVEAPQPFVEDGWAHVRVGDVLFRIAAPCDRCVLTTIDPTTLERGAEPTRSLARHRRRDGKLMFGVRLVPEALGTIHVGDSVTATGAGDDAGLPEAASTSPSVPASASACRPGRTYGRRSSASDRDQPEP